MVVFGMAIIIVARPGYLKQTARFGSKRSKLTSNEMLELPEDLIVWDGITR